jgi:hypothetical protein
MAGKIIADTLEHSTAGSIATNYLVKATAVMWAHVALYTPAITESFGTSSLTDGGTGDARINLSSALASSIRFNNSFAGSCVNSRITSFNASNQTTTVVAMLMHNLSSALQDEDGKCQVTGELA